MGERIRSNIKGYVLYIVIAVIGMALFSGAQNLLHQNPQLFQGGEMIDLNEYVAEGKEFPEDEFARLEVKVVAGPYATYTTSNESRFGTTFKSGEDYFYVVLLEDMRLMTVSVSNPQDIAAMDELAEAGDRYEGDKGIFREADFPSHTLTGKLKTMTNEELIGYYHSAIKAAGVSPQLVNVTLLELDTSAVRAEKVLLYVGGPVALAAIVIILLAVRSRKKRREEEEHQRRMAEREEAGL